MGRNTNIKQNQYSMEHNDNVPEMFLHYPNIYITHKINMFSLLQTKGRVDLLTGLSSFYSVKNPEKVKVSGFLPNWLVFSECLKRGLVMIQ